MPQQGIHSKTNTRSRRKPRSIPHERLDSRICRALCILSTQNHTQSLPPSTERGATLQSDRFWVSVALPLSDPTYVDLQLGLPAAPLLTFSEHLPTWILRASPVMGAVLRMPEAFLAAAIHTAVMNNTTRNTILKQHDYTAINWYLSTPCWHFTYVVALPMM